MKLAYTFLSIYFFLILSMPLIAQEDARVLSLEEYKKVKTFQVPDLDKDSYVKIENTYVLDKSTMPPPYFITGDDGLRKRIDLYKLLDKTSKSSLGVLIYYTNEKKKQYTALLPAEGAPAEVWNQYFEDIHATNEQEADYVLKLAYVISKELSLAYSGQSSRKTQLEGAAYGTEICFPGDQRVSLPDGSRKPLTELKQGDEILAMDPQTGATIQTKVHKIATHEALPYALTRIKMVKEETDKTPQAIQVRLHSKNLEATPNHPLQTENGYVRMGKLVTGDKLWVIEGNSRALYTVLLMSEYIGPKQLVYSLEVVGKYNQPVLNEVAVMQKD